MPEIYEHHHRVLPTEIDRMGHANNIAYLHWMLAAATAHSVAQGWPFERYQELGAAWVVRAHNIEYLRPVFAGDGIVVRTWVASRRRVTSLRRYRLLRDKDQAVVAEASTDWAFVELGAGKIVRIPPEVEQSFPVLGDDPGTA